MPLFMAIVLILLVFTGGISESRTATGPVDESDIIISTVSGGVARNVEEKGASSYTSPISVSDTVVRVPENEESAPVVEIPPVLDTLSAQNLTDKKATLRGGINFVGEPYRGKLYFVYSDNASDVRSLSSRVAELPVKSSVRKSNIYTKSITSLNDNTTYYYRVCFDASVTTCGDVVSFKTVEDDSSSSNDYREPSATTKKAENIQGELATLSGSYRLNDAEVTTAFFVYGINKTRVDEIPTEYDLYTEVREAGDDLQKVRAGRNMTENDTVQRQIDELEKSTTYYHRFCIDYDDEKTGMDCGAVRSFETKSKQRDIPGVNFTQGSRSGNNATLSASIDMGDYRNGHAFVVYGTDENRVERVLGLDEFDRVSQSGDKLQRLSIDDDFDNRETVTVTVRDLVDSPYYYLFCVEYEAENDSGRDDLFLACGDVKEF